MKKIIFLFFILLNVISVSAQENHVTIKSFADKDKLLPGSVNEFIIQVKIDDGWHINSNKPNEDILIPSELTIVNEQGIKIKKVFYPTPQNLKLDISDVPLSVWEKEIYLKAEIEVPQDLKPGNYKTVFNFGYQACNNSICLAPTNAYDTINIVITSNASEIKNINQDIFSRVTSNSESKPNEEKNDVESLLGESGLILGLIGIFFWGLALNLTPCVYPLIPITIGYFGGQSEGNTKRLALMGLLFVGGMSLTYSVIGVITALTGAVFGALLQNTFVIIFIALIFVVLSLSMFGLYEISLPNALVNKAGGAKSGLFGAFFMGLTMGIVAAPCIGPIVLALVTYVAAKADPLMGFVMFFVLSLGLGTPYLFLAIFSGKIKSLPRAGVWMEAVKHIFGFILIGMAIYFILPLLPKSFSGYILPIYMVFVGIYLIFFDKIANNNKGFRIFKIVFSAALILIAAYSILPDKKESISWQHYETNVIPASFTDKKGVIIDFYADWCIPCKELDAMTFSNPAVIKESENFYTYKADMTKSLSPEVEKLRNKYNVVGVPTVLIINSEGEEVERITGFLSPEEFLKKLKNVN